MRGQGPPDLTELVLDACARLLALSDLGVDAHEGRRRAETAVADGSALAAYERWIEAQRGDPAPDALPTAPVVREVVAAREGVVTRLGALAVGIAALELGAGRRTKSDVVDHAVGIVCHAKRGDTVARGDVLAEVHARAADSAGEAVRAVTAGVRPRRRGAPPARDRPRRRRLIGAARRQVGDRPGARLARCPSFPRSRPFALRLAPSS